VDTYPNTNTTANGSNTNALLFANRSGVKAQPVQANGFSIDTSLRHFSLLAYAVPSERVRRLLPPSLGAQLAETDGGRMAWLSVTSFLDESNDDARFEQTSYRLHVTRNGEPGNWLLGISLGSLAAVAKRNLWSMPWHLGAMEYQAGGAGHRLLTQSEWANANWRIEDAREAISIQGMPRPLQNFVTTDYFLRRDGFLGAQQVRLLDPAFTRGVLKSAQCDLLTRMGLLTQHELMRPRFAAMQSAVHCQFGAPSTLSSSAGVQLRRAA
jgi:uncharacterized protein YqjF (DUF2071 family)